MKAQVFDLALDGDQGTVFSVKEKVRNGKPVFEVMTAQGGTTKTIFYDLVTGEPVAS